MLFTMEGLKGGTMSNLRMRNSPNVSRIHSSKYHTDQKQWFNIIANSTDILISNMDINATVSHSFLKAGPD